MKLLDDIIELLMNENGSLNEALLKTKVLLRTIGHSELNSWVDDELTGYKNQNSLPSYRKISSRVLGNITNRWQTVMVGQLVPLHTAPEDFRDSWENYNVTEALGVLEQTLKDGTSSHHLSIEMPPDFYPLLSTMLSDGYFYERIWSQIELSQIRQLIISVRSRLLTFVLELRDSIGDSMSDKEAKTAASSIDIPSMFAGAVIGDNATFQIGGSRNHQQTNNRNTRGDLATLAEELRKHNVLEEDIVALNSAINSDPPTPQTPGKYGPAVKNWFKQMMNKAVEASWNIELGVASGLLTTALQNYYGL